MSDEGAQYSSDVKLDVGQQMLTMSIKDVLFVWSSVRQGVVILDEMSDDVLKSGSGQVTKLELILITNFIVMTIFDI